MGEDAKLVYNQIEEQNVTPPEGGVPRKTCTKPHCSLCNSLEHKAPQCPSRQQLNI